MSEDVRISDSVSPQNFVACKDRKDIFEDPII